jgi:hypothetical protein
MNDTKTNDVSPDAVTGTYTVGLDPAYMFGPVGQGLVNDATLAVKLPAAPTPTEVMLQFIKTMEPLSNDDRIRILRTVATFYDLQRHLGE